MSQTANSDRGWATMAAMPAVLALGLAFLYGLGAVQTIGQVNAADLTPRDVVPLIPLEQLVARGIEASSVPLALLVLLILVYLAPPDPPKRKESSERRSIAISRRRMLQIGAVVSVLAAIAIEPGVVLCLTISALAGFLTVYLLTRTSISETALLATALVVSQLAFSVAGAIVIPEPFPLVSGETRDGSAISGELVVDAGDRIYVKVRDETLASFTRAEIEHLEVTSRSRDLRRSALDLLLGRDPPQP